MFVQKLCLAFNYIENGTNHTALTSKIKCFVPRCISAATLRQEILIKGAGTLISRHFLLHIWGIGCLFLITTVIKKTFMHEGCVPYKTMHPDAECLGKENAVTVIRNKI